MGGRISDIQGVPGDPSTVFAAAGSGGLFRSRNGGVTWDSLFDRQSTISIGAIAVDPHSAQTIWVGTGESNVRNSVSFGDGVYKSTDGGKSWKRSGLEESQTISRILIDPTDSNHVLVAAVGHTFGPNSERGVFVTHDGGETWKKTLFVDNDHGASDLDFDASRPAVVYAGMWHFDRKPWMYSSGSSKGGVFRSDDGGETWHKLTEGLPVLLGRIGVKVAPSNPDVVYVIAESRAGTLFRSNDGGAHFNKLSDDHELVGRGYYFSDMRVAFDTPDHIFVLADALLESKDSGAHFRRISSSVHGDLHALWIDPKNPRLMWQGNDGGLAVSSDAGVHWEQVNNIPLGQFYHVSVDTRKPFYNVIGGTQDNGSWTGPSTTRELAGIFNDDWRMVNAMVGFNSVADLDDPDIVLTEQPGGALLLNNLKTREQQAVGPQAENFGGATAAQMKYRFNWDAPLVRSPFGKNTIYLAGNVIFQTSDYGRSWENISHDLTRNDHSRMGASGGPISIDNSASEVYSTITALAESPVKRGILWAGTDDGNIQVSLNGGGKWTDVSGKLPGMPKDSPVSHVEASRRSAATAYVSLDRHMFDDFAPHIFETSDTGSTWQSIAFDLPAHAFVWTVREDPRLPGLLYAGTETGLYARWPETKSWIPLHLNNLPSSIAVRDIVVDPTTGDMILATHGRSLWVLDDATTLFSHFSEVRDKAAMLLPVRPAMRYPRRATRYGFGDKTFVAPNAEYGALLTYYVASEGAQASIEISDDAGKTVARLSGQSHAGFNRMVWDLRYQSSRSGPRGARGTQALPGKYKARLTVNGISYEQPLTVELDPELKLSKDDLQAQFQISRALSKMQSSVASILSDMGSSGLAREAEKYARPLAAGRSGAAPKLRENIDALANLIDGTDGAPTASQTKYFHELEAQYTAFVNRFGKSARDSAR